MGTKNKSSMKSRAISLVLLITMLLTNITPTMVIASEIAESMDEASSQSAVVAEADSSMEEMATQTGSIENSDLSPVGDGESLPLEENDSVETDALIDQQEADEFRTGDERETPAAENEPIVMPLDGSETRGSDFIYEIIEGNTAIRITGWTGTGTTVVIPETIEGLPVTEIARGDVSSFQNRSLTDVTIPKTVKKLATMPLPTIEWIP